MDLRIELEPGSDPISGVVYAGHPPVPHPFVGWIVLVELIEAAAAEPGESGPEPGRAD